jgi:hypothetical protein
MKTENELEGQRQRQEQVYIAIADKIGYLPELCVYTEAPGQVGAAFSKPWTPRYLAFFNELQEKLLHGASEPFLVGNTYQDLQGNWVSILESNEASSTVLGSDKLWRYNRAEDRGRVTGSNHDMSYPLNLRQLYCTSPLPGSELVLQVNAGVCENIEGNPSSAGSSLNIQEGVPDESYAQMVAACNKLAYKFYAAQGYKARDGFKFYESGHPQERLMWQLAVQAYDHIKGTDMDDVLNMFLEGE